MLSQLTGMPADEVEGLIMGGKPAKEIAANLRQYQIKQTGDQSRVLVCPSLREENRALWDEMWSRNDEPNCPVCYHAHYMRDGPMNSDIPTYCTHWLCSSCWGEIKKRGGRECPICREDVSMWLNSHY